MNQHLAEVRKEIRQRVNKKRAKVFAWFFQTQKGGYGEGDRFIGLTVPECRATARRYAELSFHDTETLLQSSFHEDRYVALLVLILKFDRGTPADQKRVIDVYLRNTRYVNNWDLVDTSAYEILGTYLLNKSKGMLTDLARSTMLWERRIAIVATYQFIRHNKVNETFRLARLLLRDEHGLIHKAVGWMLREAGKKSHVALERFLKTYYKRMPRTMLRYAIEKFPENRRQAYLKGKV